MKREDEELSLEEQVERIRQRRNRRTDVGRLRQILNTAFMVLAAIGLVWYYTDAEHRLWDLGVIGIGMLLKIVEFFVRYGKGQLCFTTHNTSPMEILRHSKKSIDFISNDNRIIPWHTDGNFAPDNLYKNGMIQYLPFNIEAEDFLGVLGE